MDINNIRRAIEINALYVKTWEGGIRAFAHPYGAYVDLTFEEFDIFQQVSTLSKDEMVERLDKIVTERGNYG